MIAHANSCYLAGRTGHPKGPSSSYAKMYGEKRKPDVITESGVKPGKTNQVAEWPFLGAVGFHCVHRELPSITIRWGVGAAWHERSRLSRP